MTNINSFLKTRIAVVSIWDSNPGHRIVCPPDNPDFCIFSKHCFRIRTPDSSWWRPRHTPRPTGSRRPASDPFRPPSRAKIGQTTTTIITTTSAARSRRLAEVVPAPWRPPRSSGVGSAGWEFSPRMVAIVPAREWCQNHRRSANLSHKQCDQIGWFIALWATF